MTQRELDCAVAQQTGESLRSVRAMGFQRDRFDEVEDDGPHLWLDCPFCGHVVHLSSSGVGGLPDVAECARCDVLFDYKFDETYEAAPELIAGRLLSTALDFAAA